MRKTGFFLIVIAILTGCTSPRQMALFSSKTGSMPAPESPYFIIAPNDVLNIQFTAINGEAVGLYGTSGTRFVVNNEGYIHLPVIGKVKLAGMNTEEAKLYLTNMVAQQVQDPIVILSVTNATVTILGEVRNPSRFLVEGPISLPQAIGTVGGFTKNARLNNVLIQRLENGEVIKYRVNLLTDDLFSSPCFYLQKGDVVDIEPLHVK